MLSFTVDKPTVIVDQSSIHTSDSILIKLKNGKNVVLPSLNPPYSPQLNLIEILRFIKYKWIDIDASSGKLFVASVENSPRIWKVM